MKLRTLASGALSVLLATTFALCTVMDAEKFAEAESDPATASADDDLAFTEDHSIDPLWDKYRNN